MCLECEAPSQTKEWDVCKWYFQTSKSVLRSYQIVFGVPKIQLARISWKTRLLLVRFGHTKALLLRGKKDIKQAFTPSCRIWPYVILILPSITLILRFLMDPCCALCHGSEAKTFTFSNSSAPEFFTLVFSVFVILLIEMLYLECKEFQSYILY